MTVITPTIKRPSTKAIVLMAGLLLCLFGFPDLVPADEGKSSLVLVDASSNNFPPMNVLVDDNDLEGFGPDLADAVAKAAGFERKSIHTDYWPKVLGWLKSGEADFIHDTGRTPERTSFLDFSDPILEMPEVTFVRQDRWDISGLDSLKGKTVVCVDRHITHLYLKTIPGISCKVVNTPEEAINELIAGKVDAFVYPRQVAMYLIQKMRVGDELKVTGEPLRILTWCMAVKKGNKRVLDLLNKGIREVKANGRYQEIYTKWWGRKTLAGYYKQEVITITVVSVVAACLLLMLSGLLVHTFSLRKRKKALEFEIVERQKAEAENIRLQQQLVHSQKMESLGTLAGGIAHEFNNILAAIIGFTEMAMYEDQAGEANHNELNQVLKAADRAKGLVRRIMTFSQKMDNQFTPLDLNQVIEQTAAILRPSIPRMITLELRLDHEAQPVSGDQNQLEQVLLNLGSNAVDAMPAGGRLVVATERVAVQDEYPDLEPGQYVRLMVSDTGYGMDRRTVEHIFDPFFTTKDVGAGSGMGLAMVYGTVKAHGGVINCYSEPGLGTTFHVLLPCLDGESAVYDPADHATSPTPPSAKGKDHTPTVLLVDDEAALLEIGGKFLTRSGFKVLTAASGEEALDTYGNNQDEIDLVVLDISMPGMGGNACLKQLLRRNPAAKIIIASGYAIKGTVEESLSNGAVGYIAKPYNRKQLLEAVHEALKE